MLGLVPFDFKNRGAAVAAQQQFKPDSVWELTTPAFDSKSIPEFNGCPLKAVILLSKPTVTKAVPPTNQAELMHPAKGLHVALDIRGIIELPKGLGNRSGGRENKAFDFSGKFLGIGAPKTVQKAGRQLSVSEAEFLDESGSKIAVSVWQEARAAVSSLQPGTGVAVVGCNATVENNEVKVNIWPGSHISTAGP